MSLFERGQKKTRVCHTVRPRIASTIKSLAESNGVSMSHVVETAITLLAERMEKE